ncbi:MAG: exodeoxyribonuclease VII small subunit [Balneolales bacterium]
MTDHEMERLSFEHALTKLTTIVEKLESDDVTLEDSISLFEEGMKLSKLCSTTLDDADLRIEQVNKKNTK